ncbi:hypothetical protein SePPVgORF008 [Seal parapoxvirus]|uniref:Uncharacterized protein n=1 Tax=Seal parapoxvirus TaxID=187984 RepID=A0A1Z4CGD3_9POXV|nr:hypothetical protein CGV03_gp008 [Seal parapoxvirus]ASF89961.1 hypothetical protein SePPVgORF008 [Seal parapoxvirus]
MMDEELTLLLCHAMEVELSITQTTKLRRRLTKLRLNSYVVIMSLKEAMARKSWMPPGRILGTDVSEDIRMLEYMVSEVDSARENVEPYFYAIQWSHNSDVFDECLHDVMDSRFGDAVPRLALGVVESRYPHLMMDRCYTCLQALFSEDASVRFANSLVRYSATLAGALVDRSREPGGSYDELVDMVRHRNISKLRLWPRVVDAAVADVVEMDLDGLKAYCRTCLMTSRFTAGGLLEIIKDHMAPIIVECIETSIAENNMERALNMYVNFNSSIRASSLYESVAARMSAKTLYAAVVAAPSSNIAALVSYISRLPRDELNAFVRVAAARIVKSVYTETALDKHLSLKLAMELYPQMISPLLSDLVRKHMAGALRLPMLPLSMEHDSGVRNAEMVLVPVNVYTAPTTVPSSALTPPPSLKALVDSAMERANTVYEVTPLAAFGRAEITIATSHGELEVVCSTAHLVCIAMMDEAGKVGVSVEDVTAHLGGNSRLAEMSLMRLSREKIAKKRTVDSAKRFVLNTRRGVSDSPLSVFD